MPANHVNYSIIGILCCHTPFSMCMFFSAANQLIGYMAYASEIKERMEFNSPTITINETADCGTDLKSSRYLFHYVSYQKWNSNLRFQNHHETALNRKRPMVSVCI